jgi:hypothetical protein
MGGLMKFVKRTSSAQYFASDWLAKISCVPGRQDEYDLPDIFLADADGWREVSEAEANRLQGRGYRYGSGPWTCDRKAEKLLIPHWMEPSTERDL